MDAWSPSQPAATSDKPTPVLVATSDIAGGAARAGYRLHRALRDSGVPSTMLVRTKLSDDWAVHRAEGSLLSHKAYPTLDGRLQQLQRTPNPVQHSSNLLPTRWSEQLNTHNADVVNLQWIGMGAMSIGDVARLTKPVVMTLHDMWAFSGAEHYAEESASARWRQGYQVGNRPATHRGLDLDRLTWLRKKRWRPMTLVCPSRWMAACVRDSALMSDWPFHIVPYALDLTTFRPHDQLTARRLLHLPDDAKVVLFGADRGSADPRKGYELLVESLAKVHTDVDILAVVFGQGEPREQPHLGFPVRWMGKVADELTLALLYSAADVVVVPSRQDNLPQTAVEAQACGTPVVAFDTGGLGDTLEHGTTGLLAEPFSAQALASAISEVLDGGPRTRDMRRRARERAERLWSPSVIARQYLEVYAAAISRA